MKLPDGTVKVLVEGEKRVKILKYDDNDGETDDDNDDDADDDYEDEEKKKYEMSLILNRIYLR